MDQPLLDKLKAIPGVTDAMIAALDTAHRNTPQRIGRCTAEQLAAIMNPNSPNAAVALAEDILALDDVSPHVKPPPTSTSPPLGAGTGGPLQLQLVDPTDLSGLDDLDLATRFADEAQRRNPHLQREFRTRTGGLVLVDTGGGYLPDLTAQLMNRVRRQGAYTSDSFTFRKKTGHVRQMDGFLRGTAIRWRSPFTGETLDAEGHDPTMDMGDVVFPVGDEAAMDRIGWVTAFGSGFDWDDPDICAGVILMATGGREPSAKVRKLLEACALAVTTREVGRLAQARREVAADTGTEVVERPAGGQPTPLGATPAGDGGWTTIEQIPGPAIVRIGEWLHPNEVTQLANYLGVSAQTQRTWDRGHEASELCHYLGNRRQGYRLWDALEQIRRGDVLRRLREQRLV